MGKTASNHKKHKKELSPLYTYMKETEKNRRKEYEKFLEVTSEHLLIPKDVIAGQAMISMTGNHSLRVANYRSIEEYSTEQIKLELNKKSVVISGEKLTIEYSRKEELRIIGNISNISFVH